MNRILFISILIVLNFTTNGFAIDHTSPFFPGEKMKFEVRWAFIPAGEGVLKILPIEDYEGTPSYHFVFTAKTNEFVDLIYKVRDRVDSYVDTGMTHSMFYAKKHKGGSYKEVTVTFDWEKQEAQYSFFDEASEAIPIKPGTFDPLSVFFALRYHDRESLEKIIIPVTDGKKCVPGRVSIVKEEKITVAGTVYETFLVEPDLEHIGGVFKKSPNAKIQIWVTADHRKIPVRIKSKVSVGSFVADLVSYESGS